MTDFATIRAISESLRLMVENQITVPGVTVTAISPKQMVDDNVNGVSVWLYRVTRNEFLHNQAPQRLSATQVNRQPISINLHYLISFVMNDILDEQLLLGQVLQIFNERPLLRGSDLSGSLTGLPEEYRIHFETLTLEELTRIWASLQEPYRTSVTYSIEVIQIDASQVKSIGLPVLTSETTTTQILGTP